MYIKRNIEEKLQQAIKTFPILGIRGPRQSGKSTMVKENLKGKYKYITFDDPLSLYKFSENPKQFLKELGDKIIIDEVQKIPEIFNYLKMNIDNDRQNYGKYVITGSSNYLMSNKISENLAGRIGILTLLPLGIKEVYNDLNYESIFKGSYPEQIVNKFNNWDIWSSSYIDTYVERDVKLITNVGDTNSFKRFLRLSSFFASKILNMSSISRDLGVSVMTIKRWMSILESSYIIFLLKPYYKNLGKQIIKNPKLYFYDTGLLFYLMGLNSKEHFEAGQITGQIFENYIVSEFIKMKYNFYENMNIYFYRTNRGVETDLILEKGNKTFIIEIKSSTNHKYINTNNIQNIELKNAKKIILYRGESLGKINDLEMWNYKDYLKIFTEI